MPKFKATGPTPERSAHALRSSNLRFYSAVWDATKDIKGLVTFNKRFYWDTPPSRDQKREGRPQKRGALVDIVAQDGEQWIKVSTVTEKRLLFDLAKQGWEVEDSSSESDNEETPTLEANGTNRKAEAASDDEDSRIELLSLAQGLQKAALATRVRYRHPHVHFVLPNIVPSPIPEIDNILTSIRSTGATISLGSPSPPPSRPLSETFPSLLPFAGRTLTATVNIDCTILLALVSDLSHYQAESIALEATSGAKDGQPHPAIVRQLKMEGEEQLLTNVLYPLLGGKEMVCTAEAARRMREIVATIGTDDEKARTDILLDSPSTASDVRSRWEGMTHYPLPSDILLPISVKSADIHLSQLPSIASKVSAQLSDINRDIFLYGWLERITTISSNRAVVKTMEAVFEEENSEETGPDIWLVGTARSLVGKERGRG